MANTMPGGLLEGLLTAYNLKQQKEQTLAERAIQQARLESEKQDRELRAQEYGNRQADRQTDNLRQFYATLSPYVGQGYSGDQLQPFAQSMAQGLGIPSEQVPTFSLPKSPKLTDIETDREERRKLQREKFEKGLTFQQQKFVVEQIKEKERQGYSSADAFQQAMDEMDTVQGAIQSASGSQTGDISQKLQDRELFTSNLGKIAQTMIGQEPSPDFLRKQNLADSLNAQRAVTTDLKALELQYRKQLWPLTVAGKKLGNDIAKERVKLTKAEATGQELFNKTFPGYRAAQTQNLRVQAGVGQARLKQIMEEIEQRRRAEATIPKGAPYYMVNGVIRANPADPRSSKNDLAAMRSTYAKAHKNYQETVSLLAKSEKELNAIRDATAKAMVAAQELADTDPAAQAAWDNVLRTQADGENLHKAVIALRDTAKAQLDVVTELDGKIKASTKEVNRATNTKPEIPKRSFPPRTEPQRARAREQQDTRVPKRTPPQKKKTAPVYQGNGFKIYKD